MNYAEIQEALEEKYKDISYFRSTGKYAEAANNIRKVLEMMCEYYGELYQISAFKTERLSLFNQIKFLHTSKYIDKNTREAFFKLKKLGNAGSHYSKGEVIDQAQIDEALLILRKEIDKFIVRTRPTREVNKQHMQFSFDSLSEEGWCEKQNYKTEYTVHSLEGDKETYYEEKVTYILPSKNAPAFLKNFEQKFKLPRIAWELDKRIIKKDRNEYFCHISIPTFCQDKDMLYVEGHIIKENATNELIVYDICCEQKTYYYYDKYARQLEGIWEKSKKDIVHFLQMLNWGKELSDLKEGSLAFAFHYSLPQFAIYRVNNVYCIDDENHSLGMILSQLGEVVYKKENVSPNVKKAVGDLFRMHCLGNCIIKYLKPDETLDDWRDISKISLQYGLYTISLLYDYLWGFKRSENGLEFCLIDTYSDEIYSFAVNGSGKFLPISNELLSNDSIEIDFRALLEKMQQVGFFGLSDDLVENISYDEVIKIYKLILQAEADENEEKKRRIAEKELEKKQHEEKKRKLEEQKLIEEKKEYKKIKREARKTWIMENIRWILPLMPILIPILFATAYALLAVVIIQVTKIVDSVPKYININDYASVEVVGYEGIGEAELVFDYEQFEADYGEKIKYNKGMNPYNGESAYDAFLRMCDYDINESRELSNGDEICLIWDIDNEELQKYFNYGVKWEDITYTVDGLEIANFFDAFDSLTYSIDGVSMDATLSMQSTINIDGYPGLIFTSNKTEDIANNDVITVRLETENGEDVFDYCMNRYGVAPESRELEIVVSGLPEYITSYDQITEEQMNTIIAEGEQHICDYFNYDVSRGISCEAIYQGNYFYSSSDCTLDTHNGIVVVYHINRQQKVGRTSESYDFYEVYSIQNIYITPEGQLIVNYDDWEHTYHKIDAPVLSHSGYNTTSEIYPNFIERYEEEYYVQNNMQNVVDSN